MAAFCENCSEALTDSFCLGCDAAERIHRTSLGALYRDILRVLDSLTVFHPDWNYIHYLEKYSDEDTDVLISYEYALAENRAANYIASLAAYPPVSCCTCRDFGTSQPVRYLLH